MKKVSIIIPVYNSENFIENILRDLMAQTYEEIEIIVINDGSLDQSQAVIESMAAKDKRIITIQTQNLGVSSARNQGLKKASGTYIRFCDADDRVPADSIENMVLAMEKGADLVIGSFFQKPVSGLYDGGEVSGLVSASKMEKDFLKHIRTFYYGVIWNKLYKKELIDTFMILFREDIIWSEDFFFNIDYYAHCQKVYFLEYDQKIYEYVIHDKSFIQSINEKNKDTINKIDAIRYQELLQYFDKRGLKFEFEQEWKWSQTHYHLAKIVLNRKENLKKRMKTFKSFLLDPNLVRYMKEKKVDPNADLVWKYISFFQRTKMYGIYFIYFLVKDFLQRHHVFSPRIKKILHKNKVHRLF